MGPPEQQAQVVVVQGEEAPVLEGGGVGVNKALPDRSRLSVRRDRLDRLIAGGQGAADVAMAQRQVVPELGDCAVGVEEALMDGLRLAERPERLVKLPGRP